MTILFAFGAIALLASATGSATCPENRLALGIGEAARLDSADARAWVPECTREDPAGHCFWPLGPVLSVVSDECDDQGATVRLPYAECRFVFAGGGESSRFKLKQGGVFVAPAAGTVRCGAPSGEIVEPDLVAWIRKQAELEKYQCAQTITATARAGKACKTRMQRWES